MTRWLLWTATLGLVLLAGGGCGPQRIATAPADAAATPTWVPVPTFTPTPVTVNTAPIAQPEPTTPPVVASETAPNSEPTPPSLAVLLPTPTPAPPVQNDPASQSDGAPDADVVETPANTPGAAPSAGPRLTVRGDTVNVRAGPGTSYAIIGTGRAGDTFAVQARDAAGEWWQVCCFNNAPGWLFGALVNVSGGEAVAVAQDIPEPPVSAPAAVPVAEQPQAVAQVPAEPAPSEASVAVSAPAAPAHSGTAGNFDPNAQYQIVHYRTLGFDDNNGGIFNKGGQQLIFVTVLDENGNGVDGAVIKDAVGDKLNVVTGSKGPGKAEIKMDWDPYKLYVAADPSGPVSSQISNQMNNPYPHIPDVVGLLGPTDNEYAICPTPDDRCTPPFYHAHWSYEITFRRVR